MTACEAGEGGSVSAPAVGRLGRSPACWALRGPLLAPARPRGRSWSGRRLGVGEQGGKGRRSRRNRFVEFIRSLMFSARSALVCW